MDRKWDRLNVTSAGIVRGTRFRLLHEHGMKSCTEASNFLLWVTRCVRGIDFLVEIVDNKDAATAASHRCGWRGGSWIGKGTCFGFVVTLRVR
jgi:hypothetical protein